MVKVCFVELLNKAFDPKIFLKINFNLYILSTAF